MRASPGLFAVAFFVFLFDLACPNASEACWRTRRQQCGPGCGIPCWVTVYDPCKGSYTAMTCWCCCGVSGQVGHWQQCGDFVPPTCSLENTAYTTDGLPPDDGASCTVAYESVLRSNPSSCPYYAMICDCTGHYRFATPCEVACSGPGHRVVYHRLRRLGTSCVCSH